MTDQFGAQQLHRWTDRDGTEWACAAYDHGPMCRLCQIVHPDDEVLRSCLANVDAGCFLVRADADGCFEFTTTEQGDNYAIDLMTDDPELFDLYMQLTVSDPPEDTP